MNKIELKQLETQLNDLNAFVIGKKIEHTEDEIIEWVSKCISVFSGLGINEVIVSKFIEYFSPDILNESIINGRKKMGNFEGRLYFSDKYSKVNESYLIDIAFLTAKSILGRLSEEERLVPSWMLRELANNKEYSNIYSSLELIEKNYTDKDSDGIIKNSLSLLENVLDLDDDLKKEGNLGNKIKRLVGDKEKASKFVNAIRCQFFRFKYNQTLIFIVLLFEFNCIL